LESDVNFEVIEVFLKETIFNRDLNHSSIPKIIGNCLNHLHLSALIITVNRQDVVLLGLVFDYELDYRTQILYMQHWQVVLTLTVVIGLYLFTFYFYLIFIYFLLFLILLSYL
jgi:hypothetical protein